MSLKCVNAVLWCFRFPKTHVIWHHNPKIFGERTNHVSVEITPGRLTMKTKNHLTLSRALIDIVLTKPAAFVKCGSNGHVSLNVSLAGIIAITPMFLLNYTGSMLKLGL